MPEPRKLRVFLCHASQDKPIVRELYQRLLAEGWVDPWLDVTKLLPGQHWTTVIRESLDHTDSIIILISNTSVNREGFVQKEMNYAWERSLEKPRSVIYIIPIRLEECDVPYDLRERQWGDYFGEKKEETYKALLQSLKLRYEQKLHQETEGFVGWKKEVRERKTTEAIDRKETEEKVNQESEEMHLIDDKFNRKDAIETVREELRKRMKLEAKEKEGKKQILISDDETKMDILLLRKLEKIHSDINLVNNDEELGNELWQSLPVVRKKHFYIYRAIFDLIAAIMTGLGVLYLIDLTTSPWIIGGAIVVAVGIIGNLDSVVKKVAIEPELKRRIEVLKYKIIRSQRKD